MAQPESEALADGVVLRGEPDLSLAGLSRVLRSQVLHFTSRTKRSNWSHHVLLALEMADGSTRKLRLKVCLGSTFGRSEVDYYMRDYLGLADAPLVRCHDAQYAPAVGYHLLLDDLAATHHDRRSAPPTLEYGLAVARALACMHRHHWQTVPAPPPAMLDRYFEEVRPGVAPMEAATGLALRQRFDAHERALRARWADARGMSLLHGDLNSTNVLTPKDSEALVVFLDRQPFAWSLTHGLAVHDLAYFLVLWWPEDMRRVCEASIVKAWHAALGQPDYAWQRVQQDWALSVEQCLHVPLEWCSKPDTLARMRWLWEMQLGRVRAAMAL